MIRFILFGITTSLLISCNLSTQNKKEMQMEQQKTGMVEITTFKLNQGVTENEFKLSASAMQKDFLEKQKGFIKRTLTVSKDSIWTDLVFWKDKESAERTMKLSETSEGVLPFMEKIDFKSVKMTFTNPILIEE